MEFLIISHLIIHNALPGPKVILIPRGNSGIQTSLPLAQASSEP